MNYPLPPVAYAKPGYNALAIASLVLGIVWLFGLGSFLALIFGLVALGQINKTGQDGKGLAIAGSILGAIGVLGAGLMLMLAVAVGNEIDKSESYWDCLADPDTTLEQCEELYG